MSIYKYILFVLLLIPNFVKAQECDTKTTNNVLLVGDSLAINIGDSLSNLYKGNFNWVGAKSSGLINKSFYDWDVTLKELIPKYNPKTLIVFIGANDDKPINKNKFGSKEWEKEYSKLLQGILDVAADNGILVFWIEVPPMKDKKLNSRLQEVSYVISKTCQQNKYCRYIRLDNIIDVDNKSLRTKDNIHFSESGAQFISNYVYNSINNTP